MTEKEIIAWIPATRIVDGERGIFEDCWLPVIPGEMVPHGYHIAWYWAAKYLDKNH